jgi:thiamine pyrophosphate-dependent acetolactate synthase large subunit-like protein
MGFGLPAAIGCKVAAPEKIVVDIDGDASFSMTAMELATASQYNIGVKVIILNNEFQGMVLQWQGAIFPCYYIFIIHSLDMDRLILRGTLFAHPNDQPRFLALGKSNGCSCHKM